MEWFHFPESPENAPWRHNVPEIQRMQLSDEERAILAGEMGAA